MLRIHLACQEDGGTLTMLVPAHPDKRVDVDGPEPCLFRGRWDGVTYYGEIRLDEDGATLIWSDSDRMKIDLDGKHPVQVNRVFTVVSDDGKFHYVVQDVQAV